MAELYQPLGKGGARLGIVTLASRIDDGGDARLTDGDHGGDRRRRWVQSPLDDGRGQGGDRRGEAEGTQGVGGGLSRLRLGVAEGLHERLEGANVTDGPNADAAPTLIACSARMRVSASMAGSPMAMSRPTTVSTSNRRHPVASKATARASPRRPSTRRADAGVDVGVVEGVVRAGTPRRRAEALAPSPRTIQ